MAAKASPPTGNGVPLGRQIREGWVRELRGNLSGAGTLLVTRLVQIPTRDLNQLRHALQSLDGSFYVVKNSLCRLTFRELGLGELERMLEGTCGVSPIRGDAASACKLLVQFSKDHEGFALQGGWMAGQVLGLQDLNSLASLPSREVLLGQVVWGVRAPLAGLVGSLQGVVQKLVGVVHSIVKKKG